MRGRCLALALVVALMGTSAMAMGASRGGGRGGHSHNGGSAGARHRSSASSSRSGHASHYRSAASRSSYRGVATRYRAAGGRSYLGHRNHGYSSHRYRPYYGYRSYYRPSLLAGLYLGSPWYDDSYYYGGHYPETYAYPAPSADEGYREPGTEPEDMPADVENDGAWRDDQDGDDNGVADARDSGRLRLDVRPADAAIYVDDQLRGSAGSTTMINLAPGTHTVEVARPGFQTERRVVEVGEGEGRLLSIALQRAYR